jgi:hypothetical protein
MSHRQEEKERRREERLAQEEQAARTASRMRRVQMVLGGLIGVAAIVGIVAAVTTNNGSGPKRRPDATVAIPAWKERNLAAAAHAAGCIVRSYPMEGREHTTKTVKYKTNPPTSGNHNPTPAEDGIYEPGHTPAKENFVHTLEHGRVEIQYRPGTTKHQIAQLETLFNEELNGAAGYHQLLFENNTHMPYAVAATAWTRLLGCKTFNPRIFDAIRDFRQAFVDKGPEFIP